MGPLSYIQSIVERNTVMQRMNVLNIFKIRQISINSCQHYSPTTQHYEQLRYK
jgi:hypothetical protein